MWSRVSESMIRKTLIILSLLGLLLSVGLWGVSYWGVGFRSLLYSRDQLIENDHAHITELDGILYRGVLKWRVTSFDVVLMSAESEESIAAEYPGWTHYTGKQVYSGQNLLRQATRYRSGFRRSCSRSGLPGHSPRRIVAEDAASSACA